MLSLSHTLISLPFAIMLDNPLLIFMTAFIWHIFCDTLLHWNIYPQRGTRYPVELVALDITTGLVLAWLVTGDAFFSLPILAAIAGGNAPDVLHGFWDMLSGKQKKSMPQLLRAGFIFHEKSQLETNNVTAGLVSQVTLGALSIIVLTLAR